MANAHHDNHKLRLRLQATVKKETGLDIAVSKVVDADTDFELHPSKKDATKSGRMTHTRCVLANCANRASGAVATVVGSSTAFPIHKEHGKFVAMRYEVPAETLQAIRAYDWGGKPPKGTKVVLKAPQGRRRLDNYIPQETVDTMTKAAQTRAEKAGKVLGYTGGWRKKRPATGKKRPLTTQHKMFNRNNRPSLLSS